MSLQAHKTTQSAKPAEVDHAWYVVDATDVVLGRLSSRVASITSKLEDCTASKSPISTGDAACAEGTVIVPVIVRGGVRSASDGEPHATIVMERSAKAAGVRNRLSMIEGSSEKSPGAGCDGFSLTLPDRRVP